MLKITHFVVALSLLLPLALAAPASAAPHASFSHGFSSHASAPHASFSHASVPHAVPAAPPRSGFGSFGSRPAAQPSDSALSRQLGRQASEAAALRTLDGNRAAQAAQHAPQPAPGYAPTAQPQPSAAPGAPTTVIVHQDGGGIGHVIAGAMIARSLNAHAGTGYYPPPSASYNAAGGASHGGGISFFGLFLWLCLLAALGWGIWFAVKRVRSRRAANRAADKPNYTFERN